MGKPATYLSGSLEKLRQLDFIEREIPFGENPKSIELGRNQLVADAIRPQFSRFVSAWWEKLCRQAVSGGVVKGDVYGLAGRWWGNVAKDEMIELDVVAESMDGKKLLVGECKWTEREDADRLLHELKVKAHKLPFLKGKEIVPMLFLKNELKHGGDGGVMLPQQVMDALG